MSHEDDVNGIVDKIKHIHILVVEPQKDDMIQIKEILGKYNFLNLHAESSCENAICRIKNKSPFIILVDDDCCPDFCKQIKSMSISVKVIAVSGQGLLRTYNLLASGADMVIKKPYIDQDLLKTIWQAAGLQNLRTQYDLQSYFNLKRETFKKLSNQTSLG